METGDKVLILLGAKVACCGLLALAATGALGGLLGWLTDPSVLALLIGLFAVGIISIVWRSGVGQHGGTSTPQTPSGRPPEAEDPSYCAFGEGAVPQASPRKSSRGLSR